MHVHVPSQIDISIPTALRVAPVAETVVLVDEKSLVIWRGDPHTFTLAAASYQIPGPIHELPEISPTQTHTAQHGDRSHYPFAGGGTLADRKTAGPCTGHSPHPLPSVQAGVGAVVQ